MSDAAADDEGGYGYKTYDTPQCTVEQSIQQRLQHHGPMLEDQPAQYSTQQTIQLQNNCADMTVLSCTPGISPKAAAPTRLDTLSEAGKMISSTAPWDGVARLVVRLLLLGPQLVRVGQRVATEAVRLALDQGGAVAAARARDRLQRHLTHLAVSGGWLGG